MDQLNKLDEDTINHLIHKLQIDAETMENLQNHHLREANNLKMATRPDYPRATNHENHAHEFKGQKVAYRYTVAYLREMLEEARLSKVKVCPNHEGNFDCTPFCPLCEGNQEIKL